MNKQILWLIGVLVVIAGVSFFVFGTKDNNSDSASVAYTNNDYGFTFSLPAEWKGYSVVKTFWEGAPLKSKVEQDGPKLLIRNPNWTEAKPYEDIPILVFTISQWNEYLEENFSVSAAPIQASELSRSNKYVFALPPRWDYDYSLGYKDAQDIVAGNPLRAFNLGVVGIPQGKLNINVVCEQALTYMTFIDAKSADTFVADCKEGKYPEVIEKYKSDMNLGDGATI